MNLNLLYTKDFFADPQGEDFIDRLSQYKEFQWPEQLTNRKTAKLFDYDKQAVWSYISIMYDRQSSLRKDYASLPERKGAAAKMVGWDHDKKSGHFEENIEAILLGDVLAVNNAVVKYCLLQNSAEWMALVVYEEMFAKESLSILSGVFNKDSFKLITDLKSAMAKSEQALFGGEEAMGMREALYSSIETKRIGLRPEDIAEKLAQGEDPLDGFNPYGNYAVDPHKFVGDV